MATPKKGRTPLPENSVTAMLMRASEAGTGSYAFASRELLADPELLNHAPMREIALKIVAAYADAHPLPLPSAEDVADCVEWKVLVGGTALTQARRQVAAETGKTYSAVKLDHTRVRANRIKLRPR
jgi:hypothetical protein